MAENPHFASAPTWDAAASLLSFTPTAPSFTRGCALQSLRIYVRDHKMRELAVSERSLEAHYGRFVISQSSKGADEARRLALDVSYGRNPQPGTIGGHPARIYERGPEPEPDDIDGRMPSVVAWHDKDMFFLIASADLPVGDLIPVAASMYAPSAGHTTPSQP